MDPTEVLKKHLDLCNDVHQLLLEEKHLVEGTEKSAGNEVFGAKESHCSATGRFPIEP